MRVVIGSDARLGLGWDGLAPSAGRAHRRAGFAAWVDAVRTCAPDVVLLAGNLLADTQVSRGTLTGAATLLAALAPLPVVVLPGRTDPAEPGSGLDRLPRAGLDHVVFAGAAPVEVAGVVVLPCPVTARLDPDDPTRDLPPRPADDARPRVALACAGVSGGAGKAHARVDLTRLTARQVDVLVLGDAAAPERHGDRTFAPGPPSSGVLWCLSVGEGAPSLVELPVDLPAARAPAHDGATATPPAASDDRLDQAPVVRAALAALAAEGTPEADAAAVVLVAALEGA